MKTDIPDGLIDWLSHIGAQAYLNQPDIQNGRLVGNIMQNTVEGYKL